MPSNIDLLVVHVRAYELAVDAGLSASALRLLRVMLLKVDKEHFARHGELLSWPSHKEIRSLSGLGEGSVNWARSLLVASGLLTRVAERSRQAGTDSVSTYRINSTLSRDHASALAALSHRRKQDSAARRMREHRRALTLAMLNGHVYRREEP
jgi:hypothetical protein